MLFIPPSDFCVRGENHPRRKAANIMDSVKIYFYLIGWILLLSLLWKAGFRLIHCEKLSKILQDFFP
jgi:hypothetical protein